MPTLIYDIMRVMFALTGPAAFICLVNAGIALRKEGEAFLELARNVVARAAEVSKEQGPKIEISD